MRDMIRERDERQWPMTAEAKARAKAEYEADLAKRPNYSTGDPRKPWDKLSHVAQWSWSRPIKGA